MGLFDNFVTITCLKCHITFGVSNEHLASLKKTGAMHYCPNGHVQHYVQTEIVQLNGRITHLENELRSSREGYASLNRANENMAKNLDAAWRSIYSLRGVITRMKKRYNVGG